MPIWLQVIIGIIVFAAFIYILGGLICLIFARIFHTKLQHRTKHINLLLMEKSDNITRIKDMLIDDKIIIDKNILSSINNIDKNIDISKLDSKDILELSSSLSSLASNLMNVVNKKFKMVIDRYDDRFKNIASIDDSLRQTISIYNNNTLGYNYWIKVFWYRYLFKLLKSKPYSKIE